MTHGKADGAATTTPPEVIVGIDLGTTNSLVAIADEAGPRILVDDAGESMVPSAVRYEASGTGWGTVVGREAKASAPDHPRRTILSVKRLMGRGVADAAPDLPFVSYEVVPGPREAARVRVPAEGAGGTDLIVSPEEVSAEVLRALKGIAERRLGRAVTKAVVTVPAYFDDAQRQATRVAGRLAGLEVVRIVPEPTAAALAYGLGLPTSDPKHRREMTVAVYDLGGGTFDVSILRLTPPGANDAGARGGEKTDGSGGSSDAGAEGTYFFQVLATAGDTRLGGDDFDNALVAMLSGEIARVIGSGDASGVLEDRGVRRQLVALAESIKIRLSEAPAASVRIDLGGAPGSAGVYERTITREEFEGLIGPMVERTIGIAQRALRDARVEASALDAVVLVGGSTRVPMVRRRVAEAFGREPYVALNPDLVVALGAAVQARTLSRGRGAAGGGAGGGPLLLDVIPLSLGVETMGGAVAKLILRNATVPARASEMFSTSVDGQTSIRLSVYQGEREMAADCRKLGEFHLRGIPPMPAGVPKLRVDFVVDANGVLSVWAQELRSGKRASLQVIPNYGLTAEEVRAAEEASITHAREDMGRHRIADLIVHAGLDARWIGERLAKHRGELEPGYAAELDRLLAAVRGFIERAKADWRSVDANAFNAAREALDAGSVRLQEVAIAASLREDQ